MANPELAVSHAKDGVTYWIRGYEASEVKPKPATRDRQWLVKTGQRGKPVQFARNRIKPVEKGDRVYTFTEVFGSVHGVGTVIRDVEKAEFEDLAIGFLADVRGVDP